MCMQLRTWWSRESVWRKVPKFIDKYGVHSWVLPLWRSLQKPSQSWYILISRFCGWQYFLLVQQKLLLTMSNLDAISSLHCVYYKHKTFTHLKRMFTLVQPIMEGFCRHHRYWLLVVRFQLFKCTYIIFSIRISI